MRLRALAVALAVLCAPAAAREGADACAGVCERPEDVPACNQEQPVWGFREPSGVCRGGSFGYLESRESADAERLRLARSVKRACDEGGDCASFEALDQAQVVCLACDPGASPSVSSAASSAVSSPVSSEGPGGAEAGHAPPCGDDEWLQAGDPGQASRCTAEFVGLPSELALRGKCTEGDCSSGAGTLRWPSGESYTGSFRNGKRHGQGTFSWPDGRLYIGEWRDGQPSGLGTRIYEDGHFKAGYFDRGRYLGRDVDHVAALRARDAEAAKPRPAAPGPSCEEVCTEDAELRLGRINDEYECCFARHAFCVQKAEVFVERCETRECAQEARRQREDCDLRYNCDAVQTEKIARFRLGERECVESCSRAGLGEQGLRVSERGTLYDE
jgi:hypothetical protein